MNKSSFFSPFSWKCGNKLHRFDKPVVMGILNATPDSFFDGGNYLTDEQIIKRAQTIINEGAEIIDIGVVSSRPGANLLPPEVEAQRLEHCVKLVRQALPEALISVDTCFSLPARKAVSAGADIINDISGGMFDEKMFSTVAELGVPYILMHTNGTPDHMQDKPAYDDVVKDLVGYFSEKIEQLCRLGVCDIAIDPGLGFGKTVEHNYRLLSSFTLFRQLFHERPLVAALSRKSMIYKTLGLTAAEALPGTIALDTVALMQGAALVRVHDVKEAVQTIQLINKLQQENNQLSF